MSAIVLFYIIISLIKQYNDTISGQHIIQQLLTKNNIILNQDDATIIEDNNPDKEYNCNKYIKSKGFTLLHKLVLIADKYPKLSDVIEEYILLYPEEVNKVNKKGWSALLLAISNKAFKIVKLLLKHNADINVKDNNGLTALIHASYYVTESSPKIVKLLLEHNANALRNINVKANDGRTVLMVASYYANKLDLKIVKLLLEHNANTNVKDNDGMTALMHASIYSTKSSPKIVKLLIEHNADVNVKNNNGWTALMFASNNHTGSSPEVVKLLLEYDSKPNKVELLVVKNIKILNAKN